MPAEGFAHAFDAQLVALRTRKAELRNCFGQRVERPPSPAAALTAAGSRSRFSWIEWSFSQGLVQPQGRQRTCFASWYPLSHVRKRPEVDTEKFTAVEPTWSGQRWWYQDLQARGELHPAHRGVETILDVQVLEPGAKMIQQAPRCSDRPRRHPPPPSCHRTIFTIV